MKKTAAFRHVGDIKADLESFPDPVAERQVGAVGLAVQGDLFICRIVDCKVGGYVYPQLGGEVPGRHYPRAFGRRKPENLHKRTLVVSIERSNLGRMTVTCEAEETKAEREQGHRP